jgi:hypothetical protein
VEGCLLGYRTYTLTPGQVARFIFRADAAGVCPVRIVWLNLWDIDRELFVPAFDPGAWIFIGGPTGAGPPALRGWEVSAHPNPFNPSTTIDLRGPTGERVRLEVYSATGRLVRCLFDGKLRADVASFPWDGSDADGVHVPSGIYLVSAVSGESRITCKIVLVQ